VADDQLFFTDGDPKATEQAMVVVASDVVAVLPLAGMVDLEAERGRLRRELEGARGEKTRLEGQLANEGFVSRAPEHVVSGVRQKLALADEKIEVLRRRLGELGN
jgi:valyl-tRNA synthetase